MPKIRYLNVVNAACQLVAVWPFVLLFVIVCPGYTPTELVSLDGVPRILQGDTDWGRANIFATYVAGHFVFGMAGCVLFALYAGRGSQSRALERVLLGMVVAWLVGNRWVLNLKVDAIYSDAVNARTNDARYFLCDYLQVLFLFIVAYASSVVWIQFLAGRRLGVTAQVLLSPAIILLLGILCADGITPKAGRVVAGDWIIPYHANGRRHAALLSIHRFCTACTGGDAAIPSEADAAGADEDATDE